MPTMKIYEKRAGIAAPVDTGLTEYWDGISTYFDPTQNYTPAPDHQFWKAIEEGGGGHTALATENLDKTPRRFEMDPI